MPWYKQLPKITTEMGITSNPTKTQPISLPELEKCEASILLVAVYGIFHHTVSGFELG